MDKGVERMNKNKHIPLLEVTDFSLSFRHYEQGLQEVNQEVIHKLNLTINEGEIVAIVGASGSGKSLLADAILGILPSHAKTKGTLKYRGVMLTKERQNKLRGKEISLIPQSVHALDPLIKTGKQVQTSLKGVNKKQTQEALFERVGLPVKAGKQYPFELSGGMQRRVLATTALAVEPKLMIADEPTPGLDPYVLEETISEMKKLITKDKGMIFITHDIGVALQIADKVVVFKAGETIETASVSQFSGRGEKLNHPYTIALWNALPENNFAVSNHKNIMNVEIKKTNDQKVEVDEALEIKDLAYHYPNASYLFENAQLTINPGEVVGLYGPSGSGKSTMAQIIGGYKTAEKGEVIIANQVTHKHRPYPVQLIWQHPESVINPKWRMQKMLEEVGDLQRDLMKDFGIKQEWLTRFPNELSSGELQRFCLVRALSVEAKFLIADEITTMLDAVTQAEIWHALLKVANERKIGILVISHNYELLERVTDRIVDFSHFK